MPSKGRVPAEEGPRDEVGLDEDAARCAGHCADSVEDRDPPYLWNIVSNLAGMFGMRGMGGKGGMPGNGGISSAGGTRVD